MRPFQTMRRGIPQAAHRPVSRMRGVHPKSRGSCYTELDSGMEWEGATHPSLCHSTAVVQELPKVKSSQILTVLTSVTQWLYGLCHGVSYVLGCVVMCVVLWFLLCCSLCCLVSCVVLWVVLWFVLWCVVLSCDMSVLWVDCVVLWDVPCCGLCCDVGCVVVQLFSRSELL